MDTPTYTIVITDKQSHQYLHKDFSEEVAAKLQDLIMNGNHKVIRVRDTMYFTDNLASVRIFETQVYPETDWSNEYDEEYCD